MSTLRLVAGRGVGLVLVAVLALALGACSKCDVPSWRSSAAGSAPLACHGDAPTAR